MTTVVGVVVVVLGVLVSIALHEVGHMVPAKRFGVRVSQYMVGFGPTLWSRTRGETEYGLKAIPLGGYIRMVGMYPPAPDGARTGGDGFFARLVADARDASTEEIRAGEEHRAFYHLSTPRKVVVMLGGPVMNLLIAFVLLLVVFVGIGLPAATTTVAGVSPCVTATSDPAGCTAQDAPSPAAAAGLQPGDTVVAFDGERVESWAQLVGMIDGAAGEPTPVVVERGGAEVELTITPATVERPVVTDQGEPVVDDAGAPVTEPRGFVGMTAQVERRAVGVGPALETTWLQVRTTAGAILTLPARVVEVARTTFSDAPRAQDSLASVVGVGRAAVDVAGSDDPVLDRVVMMLWLLAALNVALFVFNLIPLLPLDGGHVVNALYEGARRAVARVRGRPRPGPADVARMMPVAYVMFFVLLGVGGLLIYADIVEPLDIT